MEKELLHSYEFLLSSLPGDTIADFRAIEAHQIHFFEASIGTLIRLKFLRPNHRLYKALQKAGHQDTHTMVMVVLSGFYDFLRDLK